MSTVCHIREPDRTCRSNRPGRSCSGSGCAGHAEAGSGAASPQSFPPRPPRRPSPAPSTTTRHPPACHQRGASAPGKKEPKAQAKRKQDTKKAQSTVGLRTGLAVAVLQKTRVQGMEPKLQALQEFHLMALKHLKRAKAASNAALSTSPPSYRPFLTTASTWSTCSMTFGVASSMAARLALLRERLTPALYCLWKLNQQGGGRPGRHRER